MDHLSKQGTNRLNLAVEEHSRTSSHTPGKWSVSKGNPKGYVAIDAGGEMLADMVPGERAESNARMIVRAVNAHDSLVAALRDVMGWYESSNVAQTMSKMGEQAEYHRTIRQARAALALAESH